MEAITGEGKWVEIDLGAVRHNFQQVRQKVNPGIKILGVVKANAYGHGALEVGRTLESAGADMLGVTTVQEGRRLREGGITLPVLVFGPFLQDEIETVIHFGLTVTISSREMTEWLNNYPAGRGDRIKAHLKVETGMGRTGVWPQEAADIARYIVSGEVVQLEGVYSHLATAIWKNKSHVRKQAQLFDEALKEIEAAGFTGLVRHLANSAAVLDFPELYYDMVRTGTLLYGQYPSPGMEGCLNLKDPWMMKARVQSLRELPPGQGVGYGRAYVTKRRTLVAVLPIGFADGFEVEPVARPDGLWDLLKRIAKLILQYFNHKLVRQYVYFQGGKGAVIGKVGMQLTMVDVTGVKDVKVGSVALITARRTAVNATVARVYRDEGIEKDRPWTGGSTATEGP